MATPIDSMIAEITRHRVAAGLSQSALADRAGVARQLVHRWEVGRALPTLPPLRSVLNALGLRLTVEPLDDATSIGAILGKSLPLLTGKEFVALFAVDDFLSVPRTSSTFAYRVFRRIEVTSNCWFWRGTLNQHGYGVIGRGVRGSGNMLAHCAVWELLVGPISPGMQYDHLCRNPPCVNPDHGEIVTPAENQRRGYGPAALHRRASTCRFGHPKDGITTPAGRPPIRYCKTCARTRSSRRYHSRKASAK